MLWKIISILPNNFGNRNKFLTFTYPTSLSMSNENKNLNRIKVVLAEKNLQNKWLAEQIGRDQATVSKWVTNTTQPSLDMLIKIAKVLNVDLNELVRFEEASINEE